MKDDLILRKDAVNALCESCDKEACCGSPEIESMWCFVKRTLMDKRRLPAADAVHAHWIPHHDDWGEDRFECSHCHSEWMFLEGTPEDNDAFYCNHCGARMDGDA